MNPKTPERLRRLLRRGAVISLGTTCLVGCSSSAPTSVETSTAASTTETKQPTPDMPKDSGMILFTSDKDSSNGNADVYLLGKDGKAINLTNSPDANEMNPVPSPDGRQFVYSANIGADGNYVIAQNSLQKPGNPIILADNGASNYDPTFFGNRIVYKTNQKDGHGDIAIMDTDGANQYNLTPGKSKTEEWKPTVSPDGKYLVLTSRSDVSGGKNAANSDQLLRFDIVNNPDGTIKLANETLLTDSPDEADQPDWYPSFSPKSNMLAYVSKSKNGFDCLKVRNVEGGEPITIPLEDPGDYDDPTWTLDGKRVLMVHHPANGGSYDIYSVNANKYAKTATNVYKSPGDELGPVPVPKAQ